MANDSRITLAYILGGLTCIIASIAAVTYLYHQHAAELGEDANHPEKHLIPFFLFVGIPSVAGFAVGAIILVIGIRKDKP